MHTIIHGKLRQWEFEPHLVCYIDYTKNSKFDEKTAEEEKIKERFSRVTEFVKSNIIDSKRLCSMDVLANIFCEDSNDQKKRAHLKHKLQKGFPNDLLWLVVTYDSPQMVMYKSCLQNNTMITFMRENKKSVLKEGANLCARKFQL